MKANIKDTPPKNFEPGREKKRKMMNNFNRGLGNKKLTMQEFEQVLLWSRLRNNALTEKDLQKMSDMKYPPMDNVALFPDGTEVMLNMNNISRRNRSDFTEEYWNWIEESKDKVFHLTREEGHDSLVCLSEDAHFGGKSGLYDLYSDLLVKNSDNEWVEPWSIEEAQGDYVDMEHALQEEIENDQPNEAVQEAEAEETTKNIEEN